MTIIYYWINITYVFDAADRMYDYRDSPLCIRVMFLLKNTSLLWSPFIFSTGSTSISIPTPSQCTTATPQTSKRKAEEKRTEMYYQLCEYDNGNDNDNDYIIAMTVK